MSRVFLSYSSRDRTEALALVSWLEHAEPGLVDEIFMDRDPDTGIAAGVRWKQGLRKANERCEAVICLLSQHWDDSYECKVEYRAAEDRGKPIFAVRLAPSTGRDITSEWQRCDVFGDGPKTHVGVEVDGQARRVEFLTEGLQRLQRGLRAAGIAPDCFVWPPDGEPNRAPYRGWRPLEEPDAAIYFGRDAQISRALTTIRGMRASGEENLLVIVGPSGAGKSSFLRAGLLPRLRRDDRHFLPMPVVRPQRHPLTGTQGLAASIHGLRTALGLTTPSLGAIKADIADHTRVREWLTGAQHAATERLVDAEDVTAPTLVLPLDQAEELFVADADPQCGQLLSVLASLLGDRSVPILAVATIRSDRFEPLQTAPHLADVGTRVFDDLKPLPAAQFREVICGPARRANAAGDRVSWSAHLVDRLIEDCADGADTLPLLSLTLARLYTDFGGQEIGPAEYQTLGGLRCVVHNEIDEVLAADPDERARQLERLRAAFIPWLATINQDSDLPMRRAARWTDLPADSHPLIDALVARRLLVKDDRDGEVVVEVALESLLRQWDELDGWLRAEADDLKAADSVEQAARLWNHNGRQEDWLLEGTRLADAEALAAKPGFRDRLNDLREFLLASRRREDRRVRERQESIEALADAEHRAKVEAQHHAQALGRRARVLRVLLVLVTVIALIAAVAGVWAYKAQRSADARARDAIALALDTVALQTLTGGSPTGVRDSLADQMILAARSFPSAHQHDQFALLTALEQQRNVVKVIDLPSDVIQAVFSGGDDARILSAHADGLIRQWDTRSGGSSGPPLAHSQWLVAAVDASQDGTRIVSGGLDGKLRLWDAATGREIGPAPLADIGIGISSVAFSPDGRHVAAGSANGAVQIRNVASRDTLTLGGHTGTVMSVAFNSDGTRVASGSFDGTVRIWDVATGEQVTAPIAATGPDGWVFSVAFSPDGSRIASGSTDGTVRIWDARTGGPIGAPLAGHTGAVLSVAFSPDGGHLASASVDKTVRLWDLGTGRQTVVLLGHRATVSSVVFSRDGRRLLSASDDRTLRVWDPLDGQPVTAHTGPVISGTDRVSAHFTADGTTVVSASAVDDTVRQWDAATGQAIGAPVRLSGDYQLLIPIVVHQLLLSFHRGDDADTLQFHDLVTGRPVGPPLRLDYPYEERRMWDYQSEPNRIAARTDLTTIGVWDAATMRPISTVDAGQSIVGLALSPDGRLLATLNADAKIRLWDTVTGRPSGDPIAPDGFNGELRFSADDALIAYSGGQKLQLWRTDTQQPVRNPIPTETTVTALAFSPDNTILAAGGDDGGVRLWHIDSGEQLGTGLIGHDTMVYHIEFSHDGRRILSTSLDGTIRTWPTPRPDPQALCAKLTHNMSRADWNRWVSPAIPYQAVCPGLPPNDDARS